MSKVLLLTRRFPPERCGVGDCAEQLARAFESRGDDVIVFTEPCAAGRRATSRVVELPMRGWRDVPALLRALAAAQPALVQFEYSNYAWSRWGAAFWLNAVALALRLRGLALHVALHEFVLRVQQHPRLAPLAMLQRLHFWLLAAAAREVSSNTQERVRVLRRWLPWKRRRIHYRPNGSNIPVAPVAEERRRAVRAAAGAREGDLVVALFGTYQAGKNFEAAIEAVRLVETRLPVRLWLLGDTAPARPSYVARLREDAGRLQKPAFWSGALTAEGVSAHLQAADIFLLPQADGHLTRSGSFMAAAAHGLPAIAVRNSENQQEFAHGQSVWLVEHSSPEEFVRALETLAGDAVGRSRLGQQLSRLYRERFDWAVTLRDCQTRSMPSEPVTAAPASPGPAR